MPYQIETRGDEWCVVKEGGGKRYGCHDSEEQAQAQMRALYASEKPRKAIRRLIRDEIDRRLNPVRIGADGTAFKVFAGDDGKQYWLATWTNNFEDRDGEIFSEKAINDYVKRVEVGIVPLPELWVAHAGAKTRIGQAEVVGTIGHFGIAAGSFDDTPRASAAAKYYRRHWKDTTISHGYAFPEWGFKEGVYNYFNTFEISPLERGSEANLFTSLEGVKAMALSEKTRAYLQRVFGSEFEGLEADLAERGKALEELGVRYKDFADMGSKGDEVDPEPEDEGDEKSLSVNVKTLVELVPTLIADNTALSAELATVTAAKVKALGEQETALDAAIAEVKQIAADLKARLDDRPRQASKDTETKVDPGKLNTDFKVNLADPDPFFYPSA